MSTLPADRSERAGAALPKQGSRIREILWFLILGIIGFHFSVDYATFHGHLVDLAGYAHGASPTPYQYRALMGWIIRELVKIPTLDVIARRLPTSHWAATRYDAAFFLISFGMLLIATVCTRFSLRLLTHDTQFSKWAAFVVPYMCYFTLLLPYSNSYTYPYDLSALSFFSLGILLCLQRRFWFYYLVFAFAVLNRETACFITIFFVIAEWYHLQPISAQKRVRRIAPHVVFQALLWLVIKIELSRIYAHNPSDLGPAAWYLWKLPHNLREVAKPWLWPLYLSVGGFMGPLIVTRFQDIRDPRIKSGLLLIVPLWLVTMFLFGEIIEIRVFTELIAIGALAVGLIVYHGWRSLGEPKPI